MSIPRFASPRKMPKIFISVLTVAGIVLFLATTAGAYAQGGGTEGVPAQPNQPTGTAIWMGMMDVEWNEAPGAETYEVQYFNMSDWVDLPGNGIRIAFYGAGAVVRGLSHSRSYTFRVRAVNSHGASEWSEYGWVPQTDGPRAWVDIPEPTNVPATGKPRFNGSLTVGDLGTVDTSSISDENGLGRVRFYYQWISSDGTTDTDIAGATGRSYTLTEADEGRTLKVRVWFTDRHGFPESLIKTAKSNHFATGVPTINGEAWVGETLTADTADIQDEDGLTDVEYEYQWVFVGRRGNENIEGATNATYTLTEPYLSKAIRVRVTFTDDIGNEESLISEGTAEVTWRPDNPATGAPTIGGTPEVLQELTAHTSSIGDEDGLDNVSFEYQWVAIHGGGETDIPGATKANYTLVSADRYKTIKVRVSFTDDGGHGESLTSAATELVTCPSRPTPTDIAVTAVPIVVTSSEEEYFVLYASHEVNGSTSEYPVLVKLGEDGSTTLTEYVQALPADRYRVEKYLVANPGDVDGDCVDDITELGDPAGMNPVNPASAVDLSDGAVAIPDRETFETLAFAPVGSRPRIKFALANMDADRPSLYFSNTDKHRVHPSLVNSLGISGRGVIYGTLVYEPEVLAPGGTPGVYRYWIRQHSISSFSVTERVHTLLAASLPVLEDNLALWINNATLPGLQAELPLYRASRVALVFDDDIYSGTTYQALNQGEGYGLLRQMDPDDRPRSRDVVIYEALPNELPRVAGIISTVPQTPLSHVNLRALQDSIPNAFIADALEDDTVSGLIGSHIYYAVTDSGYTVRAATQAEVEAHYASSRPVETQTPERDLTVTTITPLSDIDFDDWDVFGVKAANVAVLGTLGFPSGTVPDGFAVPFYFYDEFMKHNGFYDDIEEMLADQDFQTAYDTKVDELKKLRKKIKKGDTPQWMEDALTTMHATYPEEQSLRYRSSTNNEDLPGFNGAGLYDSKTQHPEETEEDGISKSLKQVYASLWNFGAFIERDFHRIDHMAAAMGVLVHPNYSDEQVNGVAVSVDPAYGTEGAYVNSQIGEDLVTNPEAHSVPEEVLLNSDGTYTVVALSNQVPRGQLLMTEDQLSQLRRHLETIHERFTELYGVEDEEQFAIEIEFKITNQGSLAIKQARPWIFSEPLSGIDTDHRTDGDTSLTGRFESAPATHSGRPFTVRLRFSEGITSPYLDLMDHGVKVTNGDVTKAGREDSRDDLWEITIDPDPSADVTLVLVNNIPCTVQGAICTYDGRRLSNRLEHTVESQLLACTRRSGPNVKWPIDPPAVPCQTRGTALWAGIVDLEWDEVPGADGYEVQYYRSSTWIDLPGEDIEITYYGAGAVVKGLPHSTSYEFRVRAANSHGESEWSGSWSLPQTGNLGSWAGVPEPVNSAATGTPTIGGTFQVGETLTADVSGISDENGLERVKFHYQWISSDGTTDTDINGATEASYTLLGDEAGDTIKVRVSFVDRHGFSESLISDPVGTVVRMPATGAPTITGIVRIGETLIVDTSNIADEDGLDNATFSYHWIRNDGTTDSDIANATSSTYTLSDDDEGKTIKVRVSLTDDAGNEETLTSEATALVEARANNSSTGAPTVSGTLRVGESLTADTSGIADEDGLESVTFSYQWLAGDGASETDIAGATSVTHTLSDDDKGKTVKVRVSFNDDAGNEETLASGATAAVGAAAEEVVWESELTVGRVPNAFPDALGYSSSGDLGGTLSPDHFEIDGSVYSVQFLLRFAGGLWLGIDRELPVEFTLLAGESIYEGSQSRAPVTGSGSGGYWWPSSISEWSVDESVQVNLSIQPQEPVGSREKAPLIVNLRDIPSGHDGQSTFTFELRFSEEPEPDFSYKTLRDSAFTVTGGSVENARRLNKPSNIRWEITVRPDGNGEVAIILPATTDCEAGGAICTEDGRMLFNRIELTVGGPGG